MSQIVSITDDSRVDAINNVAAGQQAFVDSKTITAKAPAKLIISGEHAVVYGFPSIAMAIDIYAESTAARSKNNTLGFDFKNLKYSAKHTVKTLSKLKDKAFLDYKRFLHGECSIREVVNKPFELLQFAVSHFLDDVNMVLPGGIDIKTHSSIPTGCGLGSSAATIMSLLYAVGNLLNINLSKSRYIELGKAAENLQHGKSSGLDIYLSVEGGCMKYTDGKFNKIDIRTSNMYLVNTGRPLVTTGECVSKVRSHFKKDKIGHDFAQVVNILEKNFQAYNLSEIILAIKENHRLLNYIGVVPEKVNNFITELEINGAAAKICGAGAIAGDNAGAVLVIIDDNQSIESLFNISSKFGYNLQPINLDSHGIKVA